MRVGVKAGLLAATLTGTSLGTACGARTAPTLEEGEAQQLDAGLRVPDAGRRLQDAAAKPRDAEAPPRRDAAPPPVWDAAFPPPKKNYCIGFGLGEPVVNHPTPALPLLCGSDCSHGEPCPAEARCYAVYLPELRGTAWVVTDRIVGYQCGPVDGVCDPHELGERYCRWCDSDQECDDP